MKHLALGCVGFIFVTTSAWASAICSEKIGIRICPILSSTNDSAYIRSRIVLNDSLEGSYQKGQERPLLVWTNEMVAKYDLRTIEDSTFPYKPMYGGELSPAISLVKFHSVWVRKIDLIKIVKEAYVKAIGVPCNSKVSAAVCDIQNTLSDSAKIGISFEVNVKPESVAVSGYCTKYHFVSITDSTTSILDYQGYFQSSRATPIGGVLLTAKDLDVFQNESELMYIDRPRYLIIARTLQRPFFHKHLSRSTTSFDAGGRLVSIRKTFVKIFNSN